MPIGTGLFSLAFVNEGAETMGDEVSTDPEWDGQGKVEEKYRKPPGEDRLRDTCQDRGLTSQHVPPCLFSTNTGVVLFFSGLRDAWPAYRK